MAVVLIILGAAAAIYGGFAHSTAAGFVVIGVLLMAAGRDLAE